MEYKKIGDSWIIVLKRGEKIIEQLTIFVKREKIKSGCFNAIGAVSQVELAHYNIDQKRYRTKLIKQPLEIVSLMGNVARTGKEIIIHGHIVVGTDKMMLYGGHLREAIIGVTCELIFKEFKTVLKKKHDKNVGLNLMSLK